MSNRICSAHPPKCTWFFGYSGVKRQSVECKIVEGCTVQGLHMTMLKLKPGKTL